MTENWLALAVAVLCPATVEMAFDKLNADCPKRHQFTAEDIEDAKKLKTVLTYTELADVYEIPGNPMQRKSLVFNLVKGKTKK